MRNMKIEKRISEQVSGLRKLAEFLPAGKARALFNKCAKIESYARKAQTLVDANPGTIFPFFSKAKRENFNARDGQDLANTAAQRAKMWKAMMAGRKISIEDAEEMGHTRAFASRISEIRSEIRDERKPYILCDEWVYPGDGRSKYKRYWLIKMEDDL